MSCAEFESHPDRARLQSEALTYKIGKFLGERRLETNPDFIAASKKRNKEIEKAQKAAKTGNSGFKRTKEELLKLRESGKAKGKSNRNSQSNAGSGAKSVS